MEGNEEMPAKTNIAPNAVWIKKEPEDLKPTVTNENVDEYYSRLEPGDGWIKTEPVGPDEQLYFEHGNNNFGETAGDCKIFSEPCSSGPKNWDVETNEDPDVFLPLEISCIEGESGEEFFQKVTRNWSKSGSGLKPFTCYHCKNKKSTLRSLKSHIKRSHIDLNGLIEMKGDVERGEGGKRHKCPFCHYRTAYHFNLRSHVIGVHTNERPYKCAHCEYETAYARALRTHVRGVHAKDKPYRCSECRYSTAHSGHLKSHMRGVHSDERPFQCDWCGYRSAYPRALRVHVMALHSNQKPFKCTQCDYSACHSSDLKLHAMNHHTLDVPHRCPYCPYTSAQIAHITTHIMAIHQSSKSPHSHVVNNSNDIQNKSTNITPKDIQIENKPQLDNVQLIDSNESNEQPVLESEVEYATFECDPFALLSCQGGGEELDDPLPSKKQYQCRHCDYSFEKFKHLKYHMKEEHPEVKCFECNQCEFSAPNSSLLKYHTMRVHKAAKGATVHACAKCAYCSGSKDKLQAHVRVKHTRVRPFKCPQCEYSSTQAGHIKIHVRAKHTNEKPYNCCYCGYQTAYSSALKSHIIKRHTND